MSCAPFTSLSTARTGSFDLSSKERITSICEKGLRIAVPVGPPLGICPEEARRVAKLCGGH